MVPITQDEAYYFNWGRQLSWGYFDHPPGVAFLNYMARIVQTETFLKGRFFSLILSILGVVLLINFYRLCFHNTKQGWMRTCIFSLGSFATLVFGVFTTPDTVVLFSWIVALHEAAYAMSDHPKRWLTAGAAVGVGLMGKFTMLIIGPVFLYALLKTENSQLKTKWPYLGGVIAFLIFLPNINWNMKHDWVTWKFQLRHGLSLKRGEVGVSKLPLAEIPSEDSQEVQLSNKFLVKLSEIDKYQDLMSQSDRLKKMSENEKSPSKVNVLLANLKKFTSAKTKFTRLGDYLGGQIGVWGFLLISIFLSLRSAIREKRKLKFSHKGIESLLIGSAVFPIVFFLMFAFNGKVEANWAAMYIFGAAPLLVNWLKPNYMITLLGASLNMLILILVACYSQFPFLKIKSGLDRVLQETYGYEQLANVHELQRSKSLFSDTYQLTSMLRYYNPRLNVAQWPGITRTSEYLHNENVWNTHKVSSLYENGFDLVTTEKVPRSINGFAPIDMMQIKDCKERYLKIISINSPPEILKCSHVHVWYLIKYQPT